MDLIKLYYSPILFISEEGAELPFGFALPFLADDFFGEAFLAATFFGALIALVALAILAGFAPSVLGFGPRLPATLTSALAFAALAFGFGPRLPATFGAAADAAFGFGPRFPATLTSVLAFA
ncbi:MAG: hypothetical protein KBF79_05570, partial [Saprospiraceae bacterium]|nr:hypothetical protein [Saprospiraceae bacterium]